MGIDLDKIGGDEGRYSRPKDFPIIHDGNVDKAFKMLKSVEKVA